MEASAWEARQFSVGGEAVEESVSYGGDLARVETSSREAGQRRCKATEEVVSYGSNLTRIETSAWKAC